MRTSGLTFIGTDPAYRGRGAGTLLVQWGIEQANEGKVPLHLESTLEAVSLYSRLGFVPEGTVSLPLRTKTGVSVYEEIIFTFRPTP